MPPPMTNICACDWIIEPCLRCEVHKMCHAFVLNLGQKERMVCLTQTNRLAMVETLEVQRKFYRLVVLLQLIKIYSTKEKVMSRPRQSFAVLKNALLDNGQAHRISFESGSSLPLVGT